MYKFTLFSDLFLCEGMAIVGDGGHDDGGDSHSLIGSSFIIIILVLESCSFWSPVNFNEIAG